jgi:hypothetical protein
MPADVPGRSSWSYGGAGRLRAGAPAAKPRLLRLPGGIREALIAFLERGAADHLSLGRSQHDSECC